MTDAEAMTLNAAQLAYIGDAVYELHVRGKELEKYRGGLKRLHRASVGSVNAAAQAQALRRVLPLLDETEQAIFRRARNQKLHPHKNEEDYRMATALEALVGYLYLTGREQRLGEILAAALPEEEKPNA